MKKMIAMAVLAAALFASCGTSKKTAANDWQYQQWLAQQQQQQQPAPAPAPAQAPAANNENAFQSGLTEYGFGRSGDKGKAYRDALRDAQLNVATRLYRVMSAVDTSFGQDTANGENMRALSNRSERVVAIIDDKTVMIRNLKEPKFTQEKGIWSCEVEVMVDHTLANAVAKEIYSSLSEDDALRVKFEEEQFKIEFEKELAAYRQRQQQQ